MLACFEYFAGIAKIVLVKTLIEALPELLKVQVDSMIVSVEFHSL
jgi:hypothetical protein